MISQVNSGFGGTRFDRNSSGKHEFVYHYTSDSYGVWGAGKATAKDHEDVVVVVMSEHPFILDMKMHVTLPTEPWHGVDFVVARLADNPKKLVINLIREG